MNFFDTEHKWKPWNSELNYSWCKMRYPKWSSRVFYSKKSKHWMPWQSLRGRIQHFWILFHPYDEGTVKYHILVIIRRQNIGRVPMSPLSHMKIRPPKKCWNWIWPSKTIQKNIEMTSIIRLYFCVFERFRHLYRTIERKKFCKLCVSMSSAKKIIPVLERFVLST